MQMDDWLKFGSLLIAIVTLIWQQRRAFSESNKKEKRVETKLRIFYALTLADRDMDEGAILFALEQGQPLKPTDKVEIRKALYEMLGDETLRYTTDKKYRPRLREPGESRSAP